MKNFVVITTTGTVRVVAPDRAAAILAARELAPGALVRCEVEADW